MEIKYPIIIFLSLVLIVATYFIKKKDVKYEDGIKKANISFLNNNSYYKKKKMIYKYISLSLKVGCIILIILASFLTSRLVKVTVTEDKFYNRDVVLCMDVSLSVNDLNLEIVKSLKETVEKLNKERYGISVFNITSVTLTPLTSDYNYILSILDNIAKSIESGYKEGFYIANYLTQGTTYLEDFKIRGGSSFIGEGLATCAKHFDKKEKDRTKVIILTTDNEVQGTPLITLEEAGDYCKRNNIIVYGIGTKGIKRDLREEFKNVVEKTGGKYYDISNNSASSIIDDIDNLQKTSINSNKKVNRTDMPQVLFSLVLIFSIMIFIIDWRMKI
jgi:hypothetical protein